jgi:hypothetical protein
MTSCKVFFETENGEVMSQYHRSDGYPSRIIPELMEDIKIYHEDGKKGVLTDYIRPYKTKEEHQQQIRKTWSHQWDELKDDWKHYLWKKEEFKPQEYLYLNYIYVITECGISICKQGSEYSRLFQEQGCNKEREEYKKNGTDFEIGGIMYSEYQKRWDEFNGEKDMEKRSEKYFDLQHEEDGYVLNPNLHRLSVVYNWSLVQNDKGDYDWKFNPYGNTDYFIFNEFKKLDEGGYYYMDEEEWTEVEMTKEERQGKRYSYFMTTR